MPGTYKGCRTKCLSHHLLPPGVHLQEAETGNRAGTGTQVLQHGMWMSQDVSAAAPTRLVLPDFPSACHHPPALNGHKHSKDQLSIAEAFPQSGIFVNYTLLFVLDDWDLQTAFLEVGTPRLCSWKDQPLLTRLAAGFVGWDTQNLK